MSKLPWFRLYSRMIDDDRLRLLAFEDRWHFVALCCLKSEGVLDDENVDLRMRRVAVKMGLQVRDLEEVKRRLSEVGLIDENMCPSSWDDLQYKSDTSSDRVKKYREKTKASKAKRPCNVSVTAQDTDTDTDTEKKKKDISTPKSELELVLKTDQAKAIIDHRRSLKKPLTAHAAQLLSASLSLCSDPNAAADMMIERGWLSIKPEWFERDNTPQSQGRPPPNAPSTQPLMDAASKRYQELKAIEDAEEQSSFGPSTAGSDNGFTIEGRAG